MKDLPLLSPNGLSLFLGRSLLLNILLEADQILTWSKWGF